MLDDFVKFVLKASVEQLTTLNRLILHASGDPKGTYLAQQPPN